MGVQFSYHKIVQQSNITIDIAKIGIAFDDKKTTKTLNT
jgi:hypothetical protein